MTVVTPERGGEMLHTGISGIFRNLRNGHLGILQQDGGGRHACLCFFLQKRLSVVCLQEPFGLPDSQSQAGSQGIQGQCPVFVKEAFFNNQVFIVD